MKKKRGAHPGASCGEDTRADILLVAPPLLSCASPHPAVPLLAAYLKQQGWRVRAFDLSLAVVRRMASTEGLAEAGADLRKIWGSRPNRAPESVQHALRNLDQLQQVMPSVVAYLDGSRPCGAAGLVRPGYLPEGPRFRAVDPLDFLPESEPVEIRAAVRGSWLLDDWADAVRDGLDPDFGFSRYAEKLSAHLPAFDPMMERLRRRPRTCVDRWMDAESDAILRECRPRVLGITVPFPGCLYGALRLAIRAKRMLPDCAVALGGGYISTELRNLSDPRLFDFVDYVVLDDGEIPLQRIMEREAGSAPARARGRLHRTFRRCRGRVVWEEDEHAPILRHRDRPAPELSGLLRQGYMAMAESLNPMARLWTERPWISLTLAHGCYWRKCAFCDTTLDYIRRFDPAPAATVLGWMERTMNETGRRSFHFSDEAAPPALLRQVAEGILKRGWNVEWWGNIRFEPAFDPTLATLLHRSGCIAVTGGLECAQDRLLACMNKGITLAGATGAMRALSRAGIMVHAYLMYGFPGQTAAEIMNALERVRRLFRAGYLHSAFWHRFALTVHSGLYPKMRHLRGGDVVPPTGSFARNEVAYTDRRDALYARMAPGLRKAVFNYMHGAGWTADVRSWFDVPVPRPGGRSVKAGPSSANRTRAGR